MKFINLYNTLTQDAQTNAELFRMIPDYLVEGFYDLSDVDNLDKFEEEFRNALDNRESLIEDVINLYLVHLLEHTSQRQLVGLANKHMQELEILHGGFDIEEDLEGAEILILALEEGF